MPEVRVVLDGEGRAVGLVREENDISHQLIEEFMLLANELVGRANQRTIDSIRLPDSRGTGLAKAC